MVVQAPDAPPPPDSTVEAGVINDARRRQLRHRLAWMLPAAAATVAGLMLAFVGGGSGPGGGGARFDSGLLRQVEQAAWGKPGTINIQIFRTLSSPAAALPGPNPATTEEVVEKRSVRDPQNYLYDYVTPLPARPSAYGVINGVEQFYVHRRNSIYSSSIWGPYIRRGREPGTFIYIHTARKDPPWAARPQFPLPVGSLTLTAAQAHDVLDGAETIVTRKNPAILRVAPVFHFPLVTGLWSALRAHALRVVGLTTVDGRRAIELAGPKFEWNGGHNVNLLSDGAGVKFWIDPKTYAPIKEVVDQGPGSGLSVTWLEYRTVPITPTNQRLLSLLALDPHAKIDPNYRDYVNANYSWFEPPASLQNGR